MQILSSRSTEAILLLLVPINKEGYKFFENNSEKILLKFVPFTFQTRLLLLLDINLGLL